MPPTSYLIAKKLVNIWFVRLVGLTIAVCSLLPMLISWCFARDRSNFWTPKQKKKPACLTDPSLGRHAHIQLKVS